MLSGRFAGRRGRRGQSAAGSGGPKATKRMAFKIIRYERCAMNFFLKLILPEIYWDPAVILIVRQLIVFFVRWYARQRWRRAEDQRWTRKRNHLHCVLRHTHPTCHGRWQTIRRINSICSSAEMRSRRTTQVQFLRNEGFVGKITLVNVLLDQFSENELLKLSEYDITSPGKTSMAKHAASARAIRWVYATEESQQWNRDFTIAAPFRVVVPHFKDVLERDMIRRIADHSKFTKLFASGITNLCGGAMTLTTSRTIDNMVFQA